MGTLGEGRLKLARGVGPVPGVLAVGGVSSTVRWWSWGAVNVPIRSLWKKSVRRALETVVECRQGTPFTLVDVGASGGVAPRWQMLGSALEVIGFEPDESELKRLQRERPGRWFGSALGGATGRRTLHITRAQTNTSLLRPDIAVIEKLQWSRESPTRDFEIVREVEIQCVTLDEVLQAEALHPDYLKLDTQGTELEILRCANRALHDDVVLVEMEVEFAPIYSGQPLFADVDSYMRGKGFILQDIGNVLYMKPAAMAGVGGAKGRIISADALYVKDFTHSLDALLRDDPKKILACVAGYLVYGYPELALVLLDEALAKGGESGPIETVRAAVRGASPPSHVRVGTRAQRLLARLGQEAWYRLRGTEHCLWDWPLGNDVL